MSSRTYWVASLRIVALLGLVALVYWPGLTGPFLFDDFPSLVQNPKVHAADLSISSLQRAAFGFDPGGGGRPLAMASFAVNYVLGGMDPWGWKLGGLVVHLVNACLVYLLCLRLFRLAAVERLRHASAWAVAALWAVHPLQVSSVLYVVQRMETLSLTFVLLALLAYLRGRTVQQHGRGGWLWIASCVPLVGLSLACKETAALFPVYTLALELTLLKFAAYRTGVQRFWRWGYGAGVAIGLVLFCAVVLPRYGSESVYVLRDFTAWQRVLTQLRVLPMYLGQMLLPSPQWMTFYYDDIVASRSLLAPVTTLWGGLALLALFGVAVWVRRRMPLLSLGILWFFAAHLITSNVVPLELAFEHRNYFALLGILLALADLVRRIPVKDGPAIKVVAVSAVVLAIAALGWVRSATWGDGLLLATELASINPRSPRAAHDLGSVYYQMSGGAKASPFFDFAQREFEREASLPNASILAEQSLILLQASQGEPVDPMLWGRLQQRLRDKPITPQTTGALFGLLENRQKGVELDDSEIDRSFVLLFERVQMPAYSYAQAANHALQYTGDEALARHWFMTSVERAVDQPEYVSVLVRDLRKSGHDDLASAVILRAKELDIEGYGN